MFEVQSCSLRKSKLDPASVASSKGTEDLGRIPEEDTLGSRVALSESLKPCHFRSIGTGFPTVWFF
jgi:hypothetical protein